MDNEFEYLTYGGVRVTRTTESVDAQAALDELRAVLDERAGILLSSGCDVPGRYARRDLGVCDPPLSLSARGRRVSLRALDARGEVLLPAAVEAFSREPSLVDLTVSAREIELLVGEPSGTASEEERTRRPSAITAVRALCRAFGAPDDPYLGLYGAFGYDLVFQLEELAMRHPRGARARDLVLFMPDRVLAVDHVAGRAHRHSYEFAYAGRSTRDVSRDVSASPYRPAASDRPDERELAPGEFADLVGLAKRAFVCGDLFELTASHEQRRVCRDAPSRVFERLCRSNPAPYALLANLGEGEYLIGASPEMYVRVDGRRVETCPIAGTIARGCDTLGDADQILALLSSAKDEAELTMCTDVDRNDKARVCEPGSVRVIGRRQIELYSRLIHTVDHVEGRLRDGYDALDALLTHAWAVTVTGAPKLAAMQFIEDHERSPRAYYGGAAGMVGFDGRLNTGLTLRTIHVRDGVAHVRGGATLLFDSDPEAEEAETELKASALFAALEPAREPVPAVPPARCGGRGRRVLLVDHRDSFVHTLADYIRQTGASVTTLRAGFDPLELDRLAPDLVVLSPGPGRPSDFSTALLLETLCAKDLPVFGVCLGLQAIAEFFGARLGQLATPVHGKASRVRLLGGRVLSELPPMLTVGRYHSLHAVRETLPPELAVSAETDDEMRHVMALEHVRLPLAAVQFHPESIMSAGGGLGLALVDRVLAALTR